MYKTQEKDGYLSDLQTNIKKNVKDSDLLLNHPAIYIHVWRSADDSQHNTWSIYVGKTNDIIERTKQHWNEAKSQKQKTGNWQYNVIKNKEVNDKQVVPTVYFIF